MQSRETSNIGYTTRRKAKQKHNIKCNPIVVITGTIEKDKVRNVCNRGIYILSLFPRICDYILELFGTITLV